MRKTELSVLIVLLLVPRAARAQGDPLGPEFRVNTYVTGNQSFPSVASDASGNFVVVWTDSEQDGSGDGVRGQRYASTGVPLGPEFRVNTYTPYSQYRPAVASDAAGNFVVVWCSTDGTFSGKGIFGQRYAASGALLGPEFRVNTFTTAEQRYPAVAFGGSGNFVVVWTSFGQDGFDTGVFGRRFAGSGAPLGPEFRVNSYTTLSQSHPAIAADSGGNFVVVWQSYGQVGQFAVFGQRYASTGAPLGPEFRANAYVGAARGPDVSSDSGGNFVVVWHSYGQDGSYDGVFGQRYASTGAPLGSEFAVNTYTFSRQQNPRVALDGAANFVVVWDSKYQDGASYGIFGQRYADTGVPLGPEFPVNTYTTFLQMHPVVTADPAGAFLVVWHSAQQDLSSFGVYGQRYSQMVPVELMQFGIE
jgi:hypothetical protein